MSDEYLPVPIDAAERIASFFAKNQVVIWSYDRVHGQQHVTTWGGPALGDSLRAAEAGNAIKRLAGWQENFCTAVPQSFVQLFGDLDEALESMITDKVLHKGTVLAVLGILRDLVRTRDPQIAEQLIPSRCESAPQKVARP